MNDEQWLNRARDALDQRAEALDGVTASRLNQARQAALGAARRSPRALWLGGAITSAAVLVLALGLGLRVPDPPSAPDSQLTDLELLADEELELLADLEFYLWLETELDVEEQG